MSRLLLAIVAVGLVGISATPSALAWEPDCEGTAVERAICAARETAGNVIGLADPAKEFAEEEAAWAAYMACEAAEHVVGDTCYDLISALA